MEPDPAFQVKFGLAACLLALLVILFFAFGGANLFSGGGAETINVDTPETINVQPTQ